MINPYKKGYRGNKFWIYLAGFLDGEGSFFIYKSERNPTYHLNPRISVCNTNKNVLKKIRNFLRYNSVIYDKRVVGNRKANWYWCVTKIEIIKYILPHLIPHLIVKKKQAQLLLEYVNGRRDVKNGYTRRENNIYKKLKELNKRGKIC